VKIRHVLSGFLRWQSLPLSRRLRMSRDYAVDCLITHADFLIIHCDCAFSCFAALRGAGTGEVGIVEA
jgi:hypothetical protein